MGGYPIRVEQLPGAAEHLDRIVAEVTPAQPAVEQCRTLLQRLPERVEGYGRLFEAPDGLPRSAGRARRAAPRALSALACSAGIRSGPNSSAATASACSASSNRPTSVSAEPRWKLAGACWTG